MNKKQPLLILTSVLVLCLLTAAPLFGQGPVCDEEASVLAGHEEFGDGWSNHWTYDDNENNDLAARGGGPG